MCKKSLQPVGKNFQKKKDPNMTEWHKQKNKNMLKKKKNMKDYGVQSKKNQNTPKFQMEQFMLMASLILTKR